jgi:hypothetical protein
MSKFFDFLVETGELAYKAQHQRLNNLYHLDELVAIFKEEESKYSSQKCAKTINHLDTLKAHN